MPSSAVKKLARGAAALAAAGLLTTTTGLSVPPIMDRMAPSTATPDLGQSQNWAGYAATGGAFTSVAGGWTIPAVTSAGMLSGDATWVGIGGVQSRDLIQAGTEATTLRNGQIRYTAWIETLPRPSRSVALTVHPGDAMRVAIAEQSPGQWSVTVNDATTNQSVQRAVAYRSSHSSAEWIEEAPSIGGRRLVALDNFGSLSFSSASATKDGQSDTIAQAGGQPITMIAASGAALATPSALGGDGASFTVTRDAPAVPAPFTPRRNPAGDQDGAPLPFPFVVGDGPGVRIVIGW